MPNLRPCHCSSRMLQDKVSLLGIPSQSPQNLMSWSQADENLRILVDNSLVILIWKLRLLSCEEG